MVVEGILQSGWGGTAKPNNLFVSFKNETTPPTSVQSHSNKDLTNGV